MGSIIHVAVFATFFAIALLLSAARYFELARFEREYPPRETMRLASEVHDRVRTVLFVVSAQVALVVLWSPL